MLIAVSMVKDFIEDRRRQKSDARENNSVVLRVEAGPEGEPGSEVNPLLKKVHEARQVFWRQLRTGDIIKVTRDSYFPADLTLLKSSQPKGICFVETKSLDGETNLKNKMAPKAIEEMFESADDLIENFQG
jgi:P-type E1-E2 ATPase